ncbi:MAG: helix-hairpin-helix domain-containing protein [Acidimicrobiales bacterium]
MSDLESPAGRRGSLQPPRVETGNPLAEWRERLELLVVRPVKPTRWAFVAVAVVAAALVGVLLVRRQAPPPELSLPMAGTAAEAAVASTTTTTAPELVVHAAGAVRRPGVYRVPPTARVVDLIEQAGGPTEAAQLDAMNLAALLVDGQRVHVPRLGEVVPGASVAELGTPSGSVIDLNTATAEQLDTLPGIGPATARSILEERRRKGRFGSVDDLLDVRGIGEAKLAEIRPLVRV